MESVTPRQVPHSTLLRRCGRTSAGQPRVAVSAVGLALTGLVELAIALVSGSGALLGDALHDLSDVSTTPWCSWIPGVAPAAHERYPYVNDAPKTSPESVSHW